ncbi:MAG: hypothetical protein HOL31_08880, partial [Candidatus Scalindua sp.]|nr:hypothetical protein [Candidatus Scalindua sp.]
MDINKINNSQVITNAFSKGMVRFNDPNLVAFNDTLRTQPFGGVLNKELGVINNHNALQKSRGNVKAANNIKLKNYPEMYHPGEKLNKPPSSAILKQYNIYKEDQLMSNPGGDNFFLNKTSGVIDNNYDHSKITKRVGKDLADAGNNLLNVVKDLGGGAKFKYVDKHGNVKDGKKVGLAGTVVNFFKNVASGLTFGLYNSEGEAKPQGGIARVKHMFKKIIKDAIMGDIMQGVPNSVIHLGEDVMFAGLNAVEVIPDATIGNFKAGREATTA